MRWLFALPLFALACASSSSESIGKTQEPIIGGSDSDATQDFTGLIILYDPKNPGQSAACTGTFLTPKLILTARHCVASTEEAATCGTDGNPVEGGGVNGDFPVTDLFVFAGNKRPDFSKGLGGGAKAAEILDDGSKFLCNHDVALILTEKPVANAKIAPIRLDGAPKKEDKVTLVGWGIADKTDTPDTRQQRGNVTVTEVGGDPAAQYAGPSEFVVDEGACSGDSGGPAVASSGAVTGVLSRGGNGTSDPGKDGCVGGIDVYSYPAAFKDLILGAYQKAGQDPWLEGQPSPLSDKLGGACAFDSDCATNFCDGTAKTCSLECSGTACPSGYSCGTVVGRNLCVVGDGKKDEGCNSSGGTGNAAWLLGLLAVLVTARRRTSGPVDRSL